jgi:hypothetical protein
MSGSLYQADQFNAAAVVVPQVAVVVQDPSVTGINGAPTDIWGGVGTAIWGPVDSPVTVGSYAQYVTRFGSLQNRKYDLGTHVAIAALQGVSNFVCVRVTDGTDVAASATVGATPLAATPLFWANLALAVNAGIGVVRGKSAIVMLTGSTGVFSGAYTGTLGNSIIVAVGPGSKSGTGKASVQLNGGIPEVYDNLVCGAGAVPALQSFTLAGGLDGASGVTGEQLLGINASPPTGMYALQGPSVALASVGVLADCDDSTTWSAQAAFGLSQAIYMHGTGPSGDTIANAVTVASAAGLDSVAFKLMFGDWIYFNDTTSGVVRAASPAAFAAGLQTTLAPNLTILNQPMSGVVASQRSGEGLGSYTIAELTELVNAGIDLVTNPIPAGAAWGSRVGHNTSVNPVTQSDQYTRMTFFLARSILGGAGQYVGKPVTPALFQSISTALNNLLSNVAAAGYINAAAWSVQCSAANNPQSTVELGYVYATVSVQYQGINEKFIVNLQGGASVTIASTGSVLGVAA